MFDPTFLTVWGIAVYFSSSETPWDKEKVRKKVLQIDRPDLWAINLQNDS
jgi:hypothetical protein